MAAPTRVFHCRRGSEKGTKGSAAVALLGTGGGRVTGFRRRLPQGDEELDLAQVVLQALRMKLRRAFTRRSMLFERLDRQADAATDARQILAEAGFRRLQALASDLQADAAGAACGRRPSPPRGG